MFLIGFHNSVEDLNMQKLVPYFFRLRSVFRNKYPVYTASIKYQKNQSVLWY